MVSQHQGMKLQNRKKIGVYLLDIRRGENRSWFLQEGNLKNGISPWPLSPELCIDEWSPGIE